MNWIDINDRLPKRGLIVKLKWNDDDEKNGGESYGFLSVIKRKEFRRPRGLGIRAGIYTYAPDYWALIPEDTDKRGEK